MTELVSVFKESVGYLLLAFVVGAVSAPFLINLLYKLQFTHKHIVNKDKKNKQFVSIHGWKSGTPTMGGILIWFIVPILSWGFLPHTDALKLFIIGFSVVGLFGFLDDFNTMLIKNNNKLREMQNNFGFRVIKLLLMWAVSFGLASAFVSWIGINSWDFTFWNDITISQNLVLLGFTFLMPFCTYCFDIYDGADGLSSGTFIINLFGMIILLALQGQFEFIYVMFMMIGVLMIFLYFNIPPARVWMGAPGAMAVGFAFFYIAVITDNIIPVFIMTLVQWIDLVSSTIQIISLKFFDKKVFKIAPLHHLFEAIGWPEYKVVMRFWLTALLVTIVGLGVGIM